MLMKCEATLLATEKRVSKKGNTYNVALFQQGVDTLQIMLPDNVDYSFLKCQTSYILVIDYSTRWKSLSIKSIADNKIETK